MSAGVVAKECNLAGVASIVGMLAEVVLDLLHA